jgi:hypothetical protein
MKKTYIFYLLATLFYFGFSQTPIVTVDRANIIGPTATGNDPSISSVGLSRGSGVNLSTANSNFTSNSWTGTDLTTARSNNDYLEWSATANASNEIEIERIDIKLRRNANGPSNWRLFYSLDNFTTPGISVNPSQFLAANSTTVTNITGLSINSGTAGTITFRLYAWGAATNGGFLRVIGQAGWSNFGIANPGLRLRGTISTTTANSVNSNIIASTFDPTDNINYSLYIAPSGLTTSNAIKVGEFIIQDGGNTLTDTDLLATILTDLEFGVTNSSNLATMAIFDGVVNIAETPVTSETVTFSGISGLSALDNSTKTFDVYATFKTAVNDNEQFQLTINAATANATLGSSFATFDAGGAQTPIAGNDNRIEVTATAFTFDQQPTDTHQFEVMTPYPTVLAVDGNNNQDLDYNASLTVSATGPINPNPSFYTMTNGFAALDNVIFSDKQAIAAMLVYSPLFAVSDNFLITGPLITIAEQNFDGSTPEWNYTTDVTPFDNGWGTDGYYGIIDSAIASPLDNPSFSGNIFGENDINDEGDNGTSGFATLTFDTINISTFDDVTLTFDWDIDGYANNNSDAYYQLVLDGVDQPFVYLVEGNVTTDTDEGTVSVNIDNAVNTIALKVSVRNRNDINGFTGFDNFKLVSIFDGFIHIDEGGGGFVGWKGGSPSNTTGANNAYVISGEYTVASQVQINNFFIKEGAKTNISAGKSLTTNSGIYNFGELELNSVSTSYSSLITDNIEGEVSYNRHVNQFSGTGSTTGNNDLISAPVTNADQTFLAFRTINTDIPSGLIGGVPSFLFGPFNNVTNSYINYPASDVTSVLLPGIGYRTASDTPTGSTFKFVGDVETGTVTVPITVGTASKSNLIGNPYPSYISLSAFLAANSTEFSPTSSGVYGYVGNMLSGFKVWNQAYSDANPSAKIAPGQGFFVNSKTGGGSIDFTPAMRTIGTTDDFIAGRSANVNLAYLNLKVDKGSESFQTDLYFNDNASLGMDPGYDSEMMNGIVPSFSIYSHLVEDNTGKAMAAQSVSYSDLQNVIVPVGINMPQSEQAVISISEHNMPTGTTVVLEDNLTNTFTNLLEGDYTFTPTNNLSGTGRFYLHFSNSTLGVAVPILNGLDIYTKSNPKGIAIQGQLESQTTFKLYDIQGRVVVERLLSAKTTEHHIEVSALSAGIYVVKLENSAGNRTQKVIIK